MYFNIANELEKETVFKQIDSFLRSENFTIVKQDDTRPWGGFFVINESQATAFATKFFPHLKL